MILYLYVFDCVLNTKHIPVSDFPLLEVPILYKFWNQIIQFFYGNLHSYPISYEGKNNEK